ncbi:hypothetical protein FSP39_024219 [Pinctada imbricata]|uniref:Laminin G domain-containing protein n=1 Tax=Pinctada imbricata TaxID=66713 RepID=A0AA88YXU6_PINIB|nr:hypothetical protein FSP39_024219 [Pinctada imbricata]
MGHFANEWDYGACPLSFLLTDIIEYKHVMERVSHLSSEFLVQGKMKTPVNKKTKKKRLKKVLKSANKSNASFSFLNSSAVKHSLRANNRALALNLQRCRHELKMATQENVELQKTIKELEMRVLTLERVAGLKDADIEAEVQRRLQETAMAMIESEVQQAVKETYRKLKDMLVKAGQSLSDAASSITSALNECIETPRRSTISSFRTFRRGTSTCSLGSAGQAISEDDHDDMGSPPSESRLSSHAIHVPESDLPLQALPPEGMQFQSHDISVIMEQPSVLMEDTERYLPERLGDIHSVPEEMTDDEGNHPSSSMKSKKKGLSKLPLPQRVPKKDHSVEHSMEKSAAIKGSSDRDISIHASKSDSVLVTGKESQSQEDDRRKTFVVPAHLHKSPPSHSQDRRGTFVVQKIPGNEKEEGLPAVSADRRGTFILPQKSSECTVLPDVKAPEGSEHTMIFNTDMEMTEVIDPKQPISRNVSPVSSKDPVSVEGKSPDDKELRQKLEEHKKKSQREGPDKDQNDKIENNDGILNKKTENSDNSAKSAVECRVTKPGKIVFSATRKDLDGFRKPVPVKKPRGKSTIKLSKGGKSLKEQTTPVKPISVFDFHDKTPNINAGKSADVYNISMDESGVGNSNKMKATEPVEKESSGKVKSRSRTRERKNDGNSEKESPEKSKSGKNDEAGTRQQGPAEVMDGMIYHLPLKGCTPEKPVRNTRGRSRSRGRKSYKDFFSESDESPTSDTNKKSRSKGKKKTDDDNDFVVTTSRGRSKSKGPDRNTNSEDLEERLNTKRSKSRARSRTRKTEEDTSKKSEEGTSAENKGASENRTEEEERRGSPELKVRSRSRGRSRSRKTPKPIESDEEDDEIELQQENSKNKIDDSPEVRSRAKSRGRSRSRKSNQKMDTLQTEGQGENEAPVRSLRSKSRTRPTVQSSSEEGEGKHEESEVRRSRGHVKDNGIQSPKETGKSAKKKSKSRISDAEREKRDEEIGLLVPDSDESTLLIEDEVAPDMVLPSSDENIDDSDKKVGSMRRKSVSRKKSVCLNSSDDCIDLESLRKSVNKRNRKSDNDSGENLLTVGSLNVEVAKKPNSTRKRKKIENRDLCNESDGMIAAKKTVPINSSATERLGMINVRDRNREVPFINDEELTFSDFDKMYQAKRTLSDYEKEKEVREKDEKRKQNNEVEEENKPHSSKSTKKRKHPKSESTKICETPKMKGDVPVNPVEEPVNPSAKTKTKGSSKKKKESQRNDDVSHSTEKENKGQNNTEMTFADKLKLLKERMSMVPDRDRSEDIEGSRESISTSNKVLSDVGNQMSGLNTPAPSQRTDFQLTFQTSDRDVILYYVEGRKLDGVPQDYEGLFIKEGKLNYFIFNPSSLGAGSSYGSHVMADFNVDNDTVFDVEIYRNKEIDRGDGSGKEVVTGMTVTGDQVGRREITAKGAIQRMNLYSSPGKVTVWIGGHPDLSRLSNHLHNFTGTISGLKEKKSDTNFGRPTQSSTYSSNSCDPVPPS